MKISNRIKELRLKNNLTQQQFANELQVNVALVAHWETERNNPKLENLTTICQKYGISADWLLFGKTVGIGDNISIASDEQTVYNSNKKLAALTESVTGIKQKVPSPLPTGYEALQAEVKALRAQVQVSLDSAAAELETVSLQNRVILSLLQEFASVSTGLPLAQWVQTTNKMKADVLRKSENKDRL